MIATIERRLAGIERALAMIRPPAPREAPAELEWLHWATVDELLALEELASAEADMTPAERARWCAIYARCLHAQLSGEPPA